MSSRRASRDKMFKLFLPGYYVQLLVRYLRLDRAVLLESLRDTGLRVAPEARPVFLDS